MISRTTAHAVFVTFAAFAIACSDEPAHRGEETPPHEHDPETPESTKKSGAVPSDGSERIEQSEECAAWLRCMAEVMPEEYPTALDAYGPAGTCWSSDAPDSCTFECSTAIARAAKDFPHATSCGGEGAADE
jgi:hypothetical protein